MKNQNHILFSAIAFAILLFVHCGKEKNEPNLTTLPVLEIGPNTALSGGNITSDEGLEITSKGVVWATHEHPTLEENAGVAYCTETDYAYSSQISGLSPGTNYHVRAFASNEDGTGYGEALAFTTTGENAGNPYGGTPCPGMETITDPRDQKVYKTVKIGSQCWLQENSKYWPDIYPPDETSEFEARYYIYNFQNIENSNDFPHQTYNAYGVLYNWQAAKTACPDGWHLPSSNEFSNLITYLGENPGGKLKSALTTPYPHPRWEEVNVDATNESGFRALPGGKVNNGNFYSLGKSGSLWTQSISIGEEPIYLNLNKESGQANLLSISGITGYSVRCIRDEDIYVATVNTLPVSDIFPYEATGNGEIVDTGGGEITEKGVCWSTMPFPTIDDASQSSDDPGTNFTVQISNLQETTKYWVRAYTINEAGISYGHQQEFITESSEYEPCPGLATFTDDRDSSTYATVLIGDQCWMRENLAYLPQVSRPTSLSESSYRLYVYGYDGTNEEEAKSYGSYQNYSVLYNFPAAAALCPQGWHLPEKEDWDELFEHLGGKEQAGGKLKSTRTVPTTHPRWKLPNTDATNESFFSGTPGGFLNYQSDFMELGFHGYWWSSTTATSDKIWYYDLSNTSGEVVEWYISKSSALSVRCIKDSQ